MPYTTISEVRRDLPPPEGWQNDKRRLPHHVKQSPETRAALKFLRRRAVGDSFKIHNSDHSRWYNWVKRAGRIAVFRQVGDYVDHMSRVWIVE